MPVFPNRGPGLFSDKQVWAVQTRAAFKTFKWLFLGALPFKLGNDASQFVGPIFLNLLLGVVENGGSATAGYSYATLMLVLLLAGTLSDNQHFQLVMRAGREAFAVQQSEHAHASLFEYMSKPQQSDDAECFMRTRGILKYCPSLLQ